MEMNMKTRRECQRDGEKKDVVDTHVGCSSPTTIPAAPLADLNSQGPSDSSPTVLEATPPTTQEIKLNKVRIVKKANRWTLVAENEPTEPGNLFISNSDVTIDAGSKGGQVTSKSVVNTLEQHSDSPSEDNTAIPTKAVKLKTKKPPVVKAPNEPENKLPSTRKRPAVVAVADISPDITEGPKKKARAPGKSKVPNASKNSIFNVDSNILPLPAVKHATKKATKSNDHANKLIIAANTVGEIELELVAPQPQSQSEDGETGGLLIEQLRTYNIRTTRQRSKSEHSTSVNFFSGADSCLTTAKANPSSAGSDAGVESTVPDRSVSNQEDKLSGVATGTTLKFNDSKVIEGVETSENEEEDGDLTTDGNNTNSSVKNFLDSVDKPQDKEDDEHGDFLNCSMIVLRQNGDDDEEESVEIDGDDVIIPNITATAVPTMIYEVERLNNGKSTKLFSSPRIQKNSTGKTVDGQPPTFRQKRIMLENINVQKISPFIDLHRQQSPTKSPSKCSGQSASEATKESLTKSSGSEERSFFGVNSGIRIASNATKEHSKTTLGSNNSANKWETGFVYRNRIDNNDGDDDPDEESEVDLSHVIDPASEFVDSQTYSQRKFYDMAYSSLRHCSDPVDIVLKKLATSASEDILKSYLMQKGIETIGDLCSMTKYEIGLLPIISPRLLTFETIMKRFAKGKQSPNSRFSSERNNHIGQKHLFSTSVLKNTPNPFSIASTSTRKDGAVTTISPSHPNLASGYQSGNESSMRMVTLSQSLHRSVSESDFSTLGIHPPAIDTSVNGFGTSGPSDFSNLWNNLQFLNELKEYMKSESSGAHRMIEFLLTDKAWAGKLLKGVFDKEDTRKDLFLQDGFQMPKDLIATAILGFVNDEPHGQTSVYNLLPFMSDLLDTFRYKLRENNETDDLKDWCLKFLASFESGHQPKPVRSREAILNQVMEDLEELQRMGAVETEGSQFKEVENFRMLEATMKISQTCLTESQRKLLIYKCVESFKTRDQRD